MATLIQPDCTRTLLTPTAGQCFTLAELQAVVGGYIELVRLADGGLVIHEEGRLVGLPPNPTATRLVYGPRIVPGFEIVGPALQLSAAELAAVENEDD